MLLENGGVPESQVLPIPLGLPQGSSRTFRHIFILESRSWWPVQGVSFDPARDLILTLDHGLKRDVEAVGGMAFYLDALCDPGFMHTCNFPMYRFFHDWHRDATGHDFFHHRDVDFGFALRLDIWNDLTFYVRLRLSIEGLKQLAYLALYTGFEAGSLTGILDEAGLSHTAIEVAPKNSEPAFYFPVHRWTDERLRRVGLRKKARDVFIVLHGLLMSAWDRLVAIPDPRPRCFIQEYHPTSALRRALQDDPRIRVAQEIFSMEPGFGKFFRDRLIPVYGNQGVSSRAAGELLSAWRRGRRARLVIASGLDITDGVNRVIESRLQQILPGKIRDLLSVIRFMRINPIDLVVLIGNVGQLAMLVDCVAQARRVPSYLIINGMLWGDYMDEAKYATLINAYSESIRHDYFTDLDNVVCLGDPRMDAYAIATPRAVDRSEPTVTVGAAGYSSTDLTSYLAVEFDFMAEVLSALSAVKRDQPGLKVVIKVRPNGYRESYEAFAQAYFPELSARIESSVPMRTVLEETDLYISFSSQTHFEASCLGKSCIYHKMMPEVCGPPFDGRSELVTTTDVGGLVKAIRDFLAGSDRFDAFLDRQVMARYIGPLDGQNLARNLSVVRELLSAPLSN